MNIGTHFDYDNHIVFVSTHTKIGTPHEKVPITAQTEVSFADSGFLNIVANFRQCPSLIVSKPLARDKSRNAGKASW